ncbi:MAG: rhodanese-like domain-containing protein [Sulfitobacter sp.]
MTEPRDTLPRQDGVASSQIMRRSFLFGGVAVLGLGGIGAARWFNISAQVTDADLTAPEAMEAAKAGKITLVDIRRPDEWARTGVGQNAVPIDMRSEAFIETLLARTDGRRDLPVALICARGVRSARMSARLTEAGFTNIIDVPEGMLGSGAGPGWIKRGLPVYRPK